MKEKTKEPKIFKGSDLKSLQYNSVGHIISPVEGVKVVMFLIISNQYGDLMLLDMRKLVAITIKSFIEKHGDEDFQKYHRQHVKLG